MNPTEPGWYPDPEQNGQDRWWDGDQYTSQTRTAGETPPPVSDPSESKPEWASQPTTFFDPTATPPPYGDPSASSYGAPPSGSSSQPGFGASPGGYGSAGYGAGPTPEVPQQGFGHAAPPYGGIPSHGPAYGGGGFVPPPPPPAQKSKAPWVVGAIVAFVAICCLGGAGLLYLGDTATTSATSTVPSSSTSVKRTTTTPTTTPTTAPLKTETFPAGYKFTHPGWTPGIDSNGFKVWSVPSEGKDPSGGKLAVKDSSAPPADFGSTCASLPSGKVESLQLGSKSAKFCKYVKDGKYVQWEGFGKYNTANFVVLVQYPGTAISSVPSMPANVQKVLSTFTNV